MGVLGLGRTWDSCASEFKVVLKTSKNHQMFSQTATKSDGGNDLGVSGVFRCWFSECGENAAAGYVWCPGAGCLCDQWDVMAIPWNLMATGHSTPLIAFLASLFGSSWGNTRAPRSVFGASRRAPDSWTEQNRSRFWNQFWGWMVFRWFLWVEIPMILKLLEVGRRTEVQGSQLAFSSQKTIFHNHFLASIRTFHGSILGSHFFPNPVFLVFSSAFSDESSRFPKHFQALRQHIPGLEGRVSCCAVQPSCDVGSGTRLCAHWISNPNGYRDFGGYQWISCIYIYIILYIQYIYYVYMYYIYIYYI